MSAPRSTDQAPAREDALLDAGAVAPVGTGLGERRDTLVARTYTHPGVEDRSVVRLVPGALGGAEDLTLGFLGFAEPVRTDEVGVVRRQALGFPAWALVHDPANGHHALDLIKDIERFARMAGSKPGRAKDGFDALAARLADAVPHFLPTYFEQAARAFLEVENTNYATTYFTRAREAEQTYGLTVDEDAQAASFLEFALAGALSVKSLTAYARGLAERCPPEEAYTRYRRICVERVAGGLPPHTTMPKDVKRLAKAAKHDALEDEVALALELLPLSATAKAGTGFWTAYRPELVRAARAEPRIRGLLLRTFPEVATGKEPSEYGFWLELLEDCGATAGLTGPVASLDPQELPADGVSRWLGRYAAHGNRRWRHRAEACRDAPGRDLLRLVERMAGRIRAERTPLAVCGWAGADIDLIDLCLALGLPVADPDPKRFTLQADDWLASGSTRDLTAITADERFRPYLLASAETLGEASRLSPRVERIAGCPGMLAIVVEWMDRLAARTLEAGLADLDALAGVWLRNTRPELLALNPAAVRRVTGLDVAARLGHALRSGIFDEYRWPVLEELCAELSGAEPGAVPQTAAAPTPAERGSVYRAYRPAGPAWRPVSQWPYLIVGHGPHLVVIDAETEVLAHRDTPGFTKDENATYRFVDGRLLVASRPWPAYVAYYTDDPLRPIEGEGPNYVNSLQEDSLPLPGGGRTFGGAPLLAGSASWGAEGRVATDGVDYWRLIGPRYWGAEPDGWQEFDPRTGRGGRMSVPAFFERDAPAGSSLDAAASWLLPAAGARPGNPLGEAAGLIGSRSRVLPDGTRVCTGVDGREQTLPPVAHAWAREGVRGLLAVPGAPGRYLAVVGDQDRTAPGGRIHLVADGNKRTAVLCCGAQSLDFARGTWCVPPVPYWSFLKVRDEAGSAALRALPEELAAALLEAGGQLDQQDAAEVVASRLPQVADPRLRAGVAGYVAIAGDCVRLLRRIAMRLAVGVGEPGALEAARAANEPEAEDEPKLLWTRALQRVRLGLVQATRTGEHGPTMLPESLLRVLEHALAGEPTAAEEQRLQEVHPQYWSELAECALHLPALALRAVSPAFDEEQRGSLLDLLAALARTKLAAPGSALRRLQVVPEDPKRLPPRGHTFSTGHGRVLILDTVYGPVRPDAVRDAWELSADGEFAAIPGWKITFEERAEPWPTAAPLGEFVAAARARGPLADIPRWAARLSALTGLSELESALVLAAMPTRAYPSYERFPAAAAAVLGGRSTSVTAAGERFARLPGGLSIPRLLALLLPERIDELWDSGPRLEAFAQLWVEHHGRREPLPAWLRESAEKECSPRLVEALLNPELVTGIDAGDAGAFASGGLGLAVCGVLWLGYTLPAGDPLLTRLPAAVARLRREATAPDFTVVVGFVHQREQFAAQHGFELKTAGQRQFAGPFSFEIGDSWAQLRLHPGLLGGAHDPALGIAEATASYQIQDVHAIRMLLDGDLERLVGRLAATVPETAEAGREPYPAQDPTRSVPELVAEVAAARGLSEDAAALYLMLLALPNPADRKQAGWLGWKPARLKAARAELAATDLVLSATRTRAGRTLFLPGPWHAMSGPHAPVEKWKGEALGVAPSGVLIYGYVLPRVTVPELYRAAWQRVLQGDGPRYEELATARRGR